MIDPHPDERIGRRVGRKYHRRRRRVEKMACRRLGERMDPLEGRRDLQGGRRSRCAGKRATGLAKEAQDPGVGKGAAEIGVGKERVEEKEGNDTELNMYFLSCSSNIADYIKRDDDNYYHIIIVDKITHNLQIFDYDICFAPNMSS